MAVEKTVTRAKLYLVILNNWCLMNDNVIWLLVLYMLCDTGHMLSLGRKDGLDNTAKELKDRGDLLLMVDNFEVRAWNSFIAFDNLVDMTEIL